MKISDFIAKVIATERLDDRVRGLQLLAENDLAAEGMKWDPEEEEAPTLRPCPACGGGAALHRSVAIYGGPFVSCNNGKCRAIGPSNDLTGAKWNALPRGRAKAEGLWQDLDGVVGCLEDVLNLLKKALARGREEGVW